MVSCSSWGWWSLLWLTSCDGLDADVGGGEGARGRGGRRLGALLSSASALLGTWGIEGSS